MEASSQALLAIVAILIIGMALGFYIGVVLSVAAIAGFAIFTGDVFRGISFPVNQAVEITTSYGFLVLPLFIMMGVLATESGIVEDLFAAAYRWAGRLPGGLAVTTVITCAGMAAITGTSLGVAVAMTKMALPELRRFGYDEKLSVGAITVAGTLAIMIPPSVTFVLYGIFAEQSIGKLLISGIIPGLMIAVLYTVQVLVRCAINPNLGPKAQSFTWKERWRSSLRVGPFLFLLGCVMAGILFGVFTPVEAASVAVVLVLLMAVVRRRAKLSSVVKGFVETASSTAAIIIIVVGALLFGKFLAFAGYNQALSDAILAMHLSSFILFLLLIVIYIILGMFLEATSILALTVPLMMPVIASVGWDPIWFGVVMISLMEVAAVTPPVGLTMFAVKATAPEIPWEVFYKGCLPFWLCNIVAIMILYFFPQIALFLPNMMIKG